VNFLGFLIFNNFVVDLFYRNSKEIENFKRVKKKNQIFKNNFVKKIKKIIREKIIK
jgi:hypothetical protein